MLDETKFEVRDKRFSFTDEEIPVEVTPQKEEVPEQKPADAEPILPVTFGSFVLSLATSALIHLGQGGVALAGETKVQLPLARQVIDLISLLEEKTKGNLTKEEEEMLSQTLFALRMKFVEIEKKHRA
jgi:hypothetical protein